MRDHSHSGIGIVGAAFELPGPAIDVFAWGPGQSVSPKLLAELQENNCQYFHDGSDRSDLDLVAAAVERLPDAARALVPRVRYLIHAHTQAFSLPAPPESVLSGVMRLYDLPEDVLCFAVQHVACAGAITALDQAARLLAADNAAEAALVVTSDRVFGDARHRIRQNAGIQSDGASAILLGRDNLSCRLGQVTVRHFAQLHEGPSTAANSAMIARHTWLQCKLLLNEHARAAGLDLCAVDEIMPINADRAYWEMMMRALDLPIERIFLDNIRLRGHACCADFAINLVDRGLSLLSAGGVVVFCGQSNIGSHAALTLLPPHVPRASACRKAERQAAPC